MIVAIHQPQYLPWLGYFDKLDKADVFCFLDNVQFKKNEWQNRNRIRTAQGWQWLTVPVHYRFPQSIDTVQINRNTNWQRKHFNALVTNYGKAPYFKAFIDFFEAVFSREWQDLAELNIHLIHRLCEMLGIEKCEIYRSSEMTLPAQPTDRLIEICRQFGGDTYLAGAAGGGYMDIDRFRENGISLKFQNFLHPQYPQQFKGFQSHLSVVDLLFNCGPESLAVLRNPHYESLV